MGNSVIRAIDTAARAANISAPAVRAVDYLRVSTDQQVDGYGIAYTGDETAAYIARKGWVKVDTFKDEGESGTLPWDRRKGAREIMELAQSKPCPFNMVVVHETRAVGRNNRVFWEWVWKLQDLGVYVAIVDDDIDNTTEEGEERMREKANEAFKELVRIRKRTQGGIQKKARMGGFPGGSARYGYRIENRGVKGKQRLVHDICDGGESCSGSEGCMTVHEAVVLRRGRTLVVKYQGDWRKTVQRLNDEGLVSRSGKPWSEANFRGRLMSEDLLEARYVFRGKSAKLRPDGTPIWGEVRIIPLDPMFTPDEVAELRSVTSEPRRRPSPKGRVYTLSGRLRSQCGKRYVGRGPANEAPHYLCSGKKEAYPGAPKCSCPQLDARGVEKWVWGSVCDFLRGGERLQALSDEWLGAARERKVDFASRLAELDRKIAEQDSTINITMAVAAQQAAKRGLPQREAETTVNRAIKPLTERLEELEQDRAAVASWQEAAAQEEQRERSLQAVAQLANDRLEELCAEDQREFLGLANVKIVITGPPPPMHRGLACPVGDWFRSHERRVPTLCDCAWERVMEVENFPGGGVVPRQRGGLAPRTVLEAFLKKARTGVAWPELDAELGSTGLIGHWRRWSSSGRWERVMGVLEDACGGVPVSRPHPLPPMEMTGEVRPGVILAATWAGERPSYLSASDPSGAAC
ncbi:recombinase family protein [Streptomyces atriruber]|uniref:recombinase family protein n=1 Tax=Streptomyces atriruber TaxID=545121 RepID=UPI00099F0FC8|nr:recombinase family protein [Streptomyces atriruber]